MSIGADWGTGLATLSNAANKVSQYSFPQTSAPLIVGEHGIASIRHGGRFLRFRANPNEFSWSYNLIKRVDQTYGGRVIQLLGCNIGDFTIKADAGKGRWEYMQKMISFLRDIMVAQRNGVPATFEYTTRGWKLRAFVAAIPFQDEYTAVARPFEIQLKVQEDISGLMTKNFLSAELRRMKDGVGWSRSQFNDPRQGAAPSDQEQAPGQDALNQANNLAVGATGGTGGLYNFINAANRISTPSQLLGR